jgi:spermidine synthase
VIDNAGSRQLRFDRYIESAIGKSPPYPSWLVYTYYFHLAFLAKPQMERALFIGAGGGIGPRAFHMQNPAMAIDVVDIDPKVLELARSHFFLDDSPKIKTFAEDGRMFVRRVRAKYDCVILDVFTAGGRIPFHLVTREFLQLCRDKMTADGVFVMNINSAVEGPLSGIFQSMVRTVGAVFPNTYVFAVEHGRSD